MTLGLDKSYCIALSLSRLRRQLPPGGSLRVRSSLGVWALPEARVAKQRRNTKAKPAINSKGDIFVIDKDDWRLRGQEDYLSGKTLFFRKWRAPKKEWDHDHCEFCWEKFSDYPDTLHEGYTTEDNYYWICPTCYNDFKEMFKWKENDRQ